MDLSINGKRVSLRDKIRAGDNWALMKGLAAGKTFADLSFDEVTDMFRRFIESWEFEGDPADTASYEGLDLFREYLPMVNAISEYMAGLVGASKN